MSALITNNIIKVFGQQSVLNSIDLDIQPGELFSLVGINGVGKTTLMKCILDFIKPDQGQIHLHGIHSQKVSSRSQLVYLPERFVPPHYLNGRQFLTYMLNLHHQEYREDMVKDMLDALDLPQKVLDTIPKQYSKGMAQKLGLAATFLIDKSFLILDEPMSGLDPKARVLVKKQLKAQKDVGKTIFFA